MINEALKLMQSKRNNSPIVPMYTINIPMDISIQIIRFLLFKKITCYQFVKIIIVEPKNQN